MRRRVQLRVALVRLGFALGRLLGRPHRRVVLATSHTGTISGNLEFIREALRRVEPSLPVTELASRPQSGYRGIPRSSLAAIRAGFELARSRLSIVDDYFLPMYVAAPRDGARYVQVWHACGAFKKFGYSVLDKTFGADQAFVDKLPIHTNYDRCLISAARFAPFYAEAFGQPIEKFDASLGIPRTDVFFGERRADAEQRARRRYPAAAGRRTILYAPTFRGESIPKARSPQDLDLAELHAAIGTDHVVLLRQHPFVRSAAPIEPELRDFVIDVSDYPDINELMLISDILVTDYSSAIYEYALLGRPMGFFAPDHAAYEAERGFYFDYQTGVPGPVFETTEEVAAWLQAGAFDLDRVARFRDESFDVADGRATERFIERVVLPAIG